MVRGKAAASEVDDFDLAPRVGPDQDIFGLEVTVDEAQVMHKLEPLEALASDLLQAGKREVALCPALSVELGKLVQVVPKKLCDYEEVLLEIEVIIQLQEVVLVPGVVRIDVLEDLDLVQGLVEKVLVVLYDFDADIGPISQVNALYGLAECCCSQELKDLVPPCDDAIDFYRIVLGLFKPCPVALVDNLEVKAIVVDCVVTFLLRDARQIRQTKKNFRSKACTNCTTLRVKRTTLRVKCTTLQVKCTTP